MIHLPGVFSPVLSFVFVISVIVFIHEMGHYLVAKWAGVKIEVFSLGFGRELFGRNDKSGTRWRVSLWPLGGYVKMYGDASDASQPADFVDTLPPEEKAKTFAGQPLWRKALIVAAGPLANFILTVVILTFLIFQHGLTSAEPVLGEVMKDSPAARAGLLAGDRVLTVNGEKVDIFQDISRIIFTNLGTPVPLDVTRGEKHLAFSIVPTPTQEQDDLGNPYTRYIIGIKSRQITYDRNVGIGRAVLEAVKSTYYIADTTLHAIGQIATLKRSAKQISGPLGMAKRSGQALEKGWFVVLWLMAVISVNLGLVNLFPVPLLDGGHLLYYAIEAVRGKALAKRTQEVGFRIGMSLISMLMVFAMFNDISSLLSGFLKH